MSDLSTSAGTPATPPNPGQPIPAAVMDLLAAIVEALDVPLPGLADTDERAQHHLMERRTSYVRATLAAIVAHPVPIDGREARGIRRNTELSPVTYAVWQQRQSGGEQA